MMASSPSITFSQVTVRADGFNGTIVGVKDTVYEGMVYKLSSPSHRLPSKPPKVKFEKQASILMLISAATSAWISFRIDALQDKWSSAYDVRTVLISIQSLLGEPNNESPLNTQSCCTMGQSRRVQERL
ncbi:hypothetical protein HPP92_001491 [Vanilla planifolia]|uniref:UBC core domain-containing protein n=1 Tax=Vanilla planifolia TaxID=51239 RepID=A0A835S4P0_VANPL|nr:hypothetical protein HPP92_001491 [Vanilla planifolia]